MGTQFETVGIRWLGHSGFLLTHEQTTVALDPYQLTSSFKPATHVLITHSHYDHCSLSDLARVVGANTVIICPVDCAQKLQQLGAREVRVLTPGTAYTDASLRVQAVRAYNIGKPFHPRENEWNGYVVTLAGVKIYHAGDTDLIPEIGDLRPDVALLPVSGTYVMTAEEAARAADALQADLSIPMHWGSVIGGHSEAETFKKSTTRKVLILEPQP